MIGCETGRIKYIHQSFIGWLDGRLTVHKAVHLPTAQRALCLLARRIAKRTLYGLRKAVRGSGPGWVTHGDAWPVTIVVDRLLVP